MTACGNEIQNASKQATSMPSTRADATPPVTFVSNAESSKSSSIVGTWTLHWIYTSIEWDGIKTPVDFHPEYNPNTTIIICAGNSFQQIIDNHGYIEGTVVNQTEQNEYLIIDLIVNNAEVITHRDDVHWLYFDSESGLLCHTFYGTEDEVYVHTYFERA